MRNTVVILLFILLLASCQCCHNKLEEALQSAASNRPELEKVLAHYKATGEKEKLAAAKVVVVISD
jgi:hypothetical protein